MILLRRHKVKVHAFSKTYVVFRFHTAAEARIVFDALRVGGEVVRVTASGPAGPGATYTSEQSA